MEFTRVVVRPFSRDRPFDDGEAVPDQVILPVAKVSVRAVETETKDRLLVGRCAGGGLRGRHLVDLVGGTLMLVPAYFLQAIRIEASYTSPGCPATVLP